MLGSDEEVIQVHWVRKSLTDGNVRSFLRRVAPATGVEGAEGDRGKVA